MTYEVAELRNDQRWAYLCALDEELLKGGVILSEWCSLIICEADEAFAAGAYLGSVLTAVAGIEAFLRFDMQVSGSSHGLSKLIDSAPLDAGLKADLHALRKYRNEWVHVDDPNDDEKLAARSSDDLRNAAFHAMRCLRRTLYANQWV